MNFFLNVRQSKEIRGLHEVKENNFKVIQQKLNLPMNFFETFPESSLLSTVSKKTIKMIGHYSRLRDMMGQSYPIHACTSANHKNYNFLDCDWFKKLPFSH